MAKFKVRFKEYEVLRNEKREVISRTTVDVWEKTIEAPTLEEVLNKAGEEAKRLMEEDDMAEVTYEAEISPF